MNEAVPVPFEVKLPVPGTGLGLVLQQTPLTVIGAPPSLVIVPPDDAEVGVMAVIAVVDAITGTDGAGVVNVTSAP